MAKTTPTRTEAALDAVQAAVAAAKTVRSAEAEIRTQHEALLKERKGIRSGYASEAEIVANLNRLVDQRAAEWARDAGARTARSLSGETEFRGHPLKEHPVPPNLPRWGDLHGTLTFDDFIGLAPEVVKARLAAVVHNSGARFGLPAAERAARLAEVENAIGEAEAQHEALVSGAAAVGIDLPALPAVAERRERERAEKATADALAEERARGVYTVGA